MSDFWKDAVRGPVLYPSNSQDAPVAKAVREQQAQEQAQEYRQAVLNNPKATVEQLLSIGMTWQEIFEMGKLGPFKTFEDAYTNAQKQQPAVAKLYPMPTETKELPLSPVRGTNEDGEETITFTAQGMKRFLTLINPAQDGRLSGIDPNSNIGVNPYAMKAPLTPEQAAQTDPVQNLRINANATPLPDDVLAQLRMDAQAKQQVPGSPRPANPLIR